MFRAPICTTSAYSAMASACMPFSSSVTIGQAGLLARFGEDLQAVDAEAVEGERRRARFERTAAQHRGAGGLDGTRDAQRLLAGLDGARPGDERERGTAADGPTADLEHGGLVVVQLARGEFVGARDRDDAIHAGHPLEAELPHTLGVADRSDCGRQLPRHHGDVHAGRLELRADSVDLLGRRPGGHHDHHGHRRVIPRRRTSGFGSGGRRNGRSTSRERAPGAERPVFAVAPEKMDGRPSGGADLARVRLCLAWETARSEGWQPITKGWSRDGS